MGPPVIASPRRRLRLALPRVAPSLSHNATLDKAARRGEKQDSSARQAPRVPTRLREPGEREAVEARNERVRRPRPGRDNGDPRGARRDRRDAREEAVDLRPRDEKGDRPRDVAAASRRPVAPPLDSRLPHEPLRQLPELDDARRAVGALAAGPLDRVPTVQTQELDAHLDAAPKLTERRPNELRVGAEPGVEVRRWHNGAEPERHHGGRVE